ncbi:NTE family protein [Plasticicumulans lactativorans]|uniref:NTE family protein n=1 Tax=Plasticicumulans lactativorans TaxID=1133106 RepID=A0A4R2L274_9GAMM|nr:patatin-like phospholipase family protein [Plasticicumulans lactativorans]TCO80564.1 NTE family protein [Plasticicumulans lactativorans]
MTANPDFGLRRINIALQGGGAHGAFTWGVLDRLLEDGRIAVDAISGTSAGAMNAAVLASGLASGGPAGARAALDRFWRRIADAARLGPLQPSWMDRMLGTGNLDWSPLWFMFDTMTRFFSPYELNPMNVNPLRDVLIDVVDFERLRASTDVKLFLCATNVRRGRIRVFETAEITADTVLASACLPFLFQAVEIDGEHYWDGGYMGNPPIYPLIYNADSRDVLIIRINPIEIPKVPTTAREILDRVNTLSFNSSLMREMRAIDFVTKLIDQGALDPAQYKRMRIHSIDAEERMAKLSVSSKLNADWGFLQELRALGRERADAWLAQHFDDLGERSSVSIADVFL